MQNKSFLQQRTPVGDLYQKKLQDAEFLKKKAQEKHVFFEKITKIFGDCEIDLNEIQKEQFFELYFLLKFWNEFVNLTAITQMDDVIVKHFLDSAILAKNLVGNEKIVDVGCGAGFPGLPLKIVAPKTKLVLVDCINKKLEFARAFVAQNNIDDVQVVHARAFDLQHNLDFFENFDVAVCRAVAKMPVITQFCLPFLKVGGKFFAFKSSGVDEEIDEGFLQTVENLGGKFEQVFEQSFFDLSRKFVLVKKTKNTPKFMLGKKK